MEQDLSEAHFIYLLILMSKRHSGEHVKENIIAISRSREYVKHIRQCTELSSYYQLPQEDIKKGLSPRWFSGDVKELYLEIRELQETIFIEE
jgi:hypothetical protein